MDKKHAENFKRYEQIVEIAKVKNKTNIILGQLFYELKENDYFETNDITFSAFLADPEINLSETVAYRNINVYKKYVIKFGLKIEDIQHLDLMKLDRIKAVVNKTNIKEWLEKIETLSRSDIDRLVKYPNKNPMTCKHSWKCSKEKCNNCGEIRNIRK
jgi:hypothetical protein|tara:strand:+ start:835 stop:1308 length:474 start_codon:yes stop_codon:yes gene_type:complete